VAHEALHAIVPLALGHSVSLEMDASECSWHAETDEEWSERSPASWALMALAPLCVGLLLVVFLPYLQAQMESTVLEVYLIISVAMIVLPSASDIAFGIGCLGMWWRGDGETMEEAASEVEGGES